MANDVNKRGAPRKRVTQSGVVVHDDGAQKLDCTIVDISESGARVKLVKPRATPDDVYLIVLADKRVHRATVVWREGGLLGLNFVSTFDLAKLPSPDLRYLNRIWIERSMR